MMQLIHKGPKCRLYGSWTMEEYYIVQPMLEKHIQSDVTWRIWSYANGDFKAKRSDKKDDTISVKGIEKLVEKLQEA